MGRKPLAATAIAVAIAGCGSTTTTTQTVSQPQTETATTTVTVTKHAGARTVTATTSAATSQAGAPPASSGSAGRSFSGNGIKNLGNITVASDSTLSWTNDGGLFSILAPQDNLVISSQAHSGTSAISAGTYHNVSVNAIGNWTIKISPG